MKTKTFWAGPFSERCQKYLGFYRSQKAESLAGGKLVKVTLREAREGEEPEYWGFDSYSEDNPGWCMIWQSFVQLRMCFTYGLEAAEEHGDGKRIGLMIVRDDD